MANFTAPASDNTYIPNTEATNNMVVDFSRNPSKFALPKYVQYVPVTKGNNRYWEMKLEQAARVLTNDGADTLWHDGDDRPSFNNELDEFIARSFLTQRRAKGFRIGEKAADQAAWKVLAQSSRNTVQRMMTVRTQLVMNLLTATGNWPSGHTADVTSIPKITGEWDLSTVARSDIKRSLDYAANQIILATNGAVLPEDMIIVMNPNVAREIVVSAEIRDFMKQSPFAKRLVEGNLGPVNNFGLPDRLYDYGCVVEHTVKVTNRKGATRAASYVLPDNAAIMVSRPGGLDGIEDSPSFSTVQLFFKEELSIEEFHDKKNRRHLGSVVEDYAQHLTASMTGYLFQNPLS